MEIPPEWGQQSWWQNIADRAAARKWDAGATLRMRALRELCCARPMIELSRAVKLGDRSGLSGPGWQLLARFRLGIPLTEEL